MARNDMTYIEAIHAMQSGVAYDHATGSKDGIPKYLRVGVNSAMSDHCALVKLLIAKGLFTEAEYIEAIRLEMIREVERYEKNLSEKTGKDVTLG